MFKIDYTADFNSNLMSVRKHTTEEKRIIPRFKKINKIMFSQTSYTYIRTDIRSNSFQTYDDLIDQSSS